MILVTVVSFVLLATHLNWLFQLAGFETRFLIRTRSPTNIVSVTRLVVRALPFEISALFLNQRLFFDLQRPQIRYDVLGSSLFHILSVQKKEKQPHVLFKSFQSSRIVSTRCFRFGSLLSRNNVVKSPPSDVPYGPEPSTDVPDGE